MKIVVSNSGRRWLKLGLWLSGGFLATIVLAFSLLVITVDPNRFKPLISSQVKAQTGAELSLGQLQWHFAPFPAIVAHDIQWLSPHALNNTPLLKIAKLSVEPQLLPLLFKQIAIANIEISGAQVQLVSDGARNNWTLQPAPTSPSSNGSSSTSPLLIKRISINDASIDYQDLAAHTQTSLPHLTATLSHGFAGELSFTNDQITLSKAILNINNQLTLKFNANYNATNYQLALTSNQFSLAQLLSSCGYQVAANLSRPIWQQLQLGVDLNGSPQSLTVKQATLNLSDKTNLTLTATATSLQPLNATTTLTINQIEVSDFMPLNNYQLNASDIRIDGNLQQNARNQLSLNQDLTILNLKWRGYDLHQQVSRLGQLLDSPLKIIDIPHTLAQVKASLAPLSQNGPKNLQLSSNLGQLSAKINYQDNQISFNPLTLSGPDLLVHGHGDMIMPKGWLTAKLNLQIVGSNGLMSRLVYPLAINGNDASMDWSSISQQMANNLGSTLKSTGKGVANKADSGLREITRKIKSWF